MAAERPNIVSAKNDIVQVALPFIEGTCETFLIADVSAGAESLTVKDNAKFQNNDYLEIGPTGGQQTEIVRITAVPSYGTSLTVEALTFSHGMGTKVALIRYNQVAIYGSSSATDGAPTAIGSAENLDARRGYNEIKASTTYTYYYARFYNEQAATYSAYSDSIAATGLTAQARGEIKREFLSIYNEKIDDLITEDWLNRAVNRWQRDLIKRRKNWSCLHSKANIDLVQDQQAYDMPSDIQDTDTTDAVMSVKYYNQPDLTEVDQRVFASVTYTYIGTTLSANVAAIDTEMNLADTSDLADDGKVYIQGDEIDYTAKSSTQLTGVTNIVAAGHTSGDEVWQTRTAGIPNTYTVARGKLYLDPIPDGTAAGRNLYIEYWAKFTNLSDDQDTTVFLYPENCYLYLSWQLAMRRKLPVQEQTFRQKVWRDDLEERVAEDPDVRDILLGPVNYYRNPY